MPNFMVIDLSHYISSVDFGAVKAAGVVGVIHKATQGTGFVDVMYAQRKEAALAQGLLWGAYHFGTGDDTQTQLQHFLKTVNPDSSTLVALDLETNGSDPSNTMSLAQGRAFLQGIESALKRKAVLYCGAYLKEQLGSAADPYFGLHRLWWAQFANEPVIQASWKSYWLWQHTDGFHGPDPKSVDGAGNCDCDTYDNSAATLAQSWAI